MRGMARTAVVAGTATAVSNRVSRRQAQRWGAQDSAAYEEQAAAAPPPPAPPPADPMDAKLEQLKSLGELHAQGVLTDAEFEAQKSRLLNS
jgi:hypothetical protein